MGHVIVFYNRVVFFLIIETLFHNNDRLNKKSQN